MSVFGSKTIAPQADNPLSFEAITVTDTATGLTTIPATANKAIVTVETASLRYRDDGTNPTSTVGHFMRPGAVIFLTGRNAISNFNVIRTGATSSKINVDYYNVQ